MQRKASAATLEKGGDAWSVTELHLEVEGDIPNIDRAKFESAAYEAKKNCPISRLLNAKITLNAILKQRAA